MPAIISPVETVLSHITDKITHIIPDNKIQDALVFFYIHDGKYYHVDQKCNLAEHPSVLQHKTCNIYFPEHLEHPPIPCTSVFFTALIVLFNPLHPNELWYLLPFSVIYTPVDASPYTHFSQA